MTTSDDRPEHILPRFSLNRRVTVLVLLATTLVVGTIATLGIPLELIPRGFDDPSLFVFTRWQDAPAEEIMEKVTLPMEEELSTVPGLKDTFSFATTGFTRWFLSFKQGTDMDVAYREVRDRIERARARMPEDIERVQIRKHDDAAIPVFMMGLAIEPQATDVYNLIQNEVVLPLRRIDGVADVETRGLEEKEILIELDRERVSSAGLNIYELSQELGTDNFSLASGHVRSSGKKLLLRSLAKYPDLEALENRMVGPSVRLKDIATVTYDVPDKKYRVRAMSKPAVMILVMKEGEANALAVTDRVAAAVDKMDDNPRLALIGREVFFSQGATIRESLGIMFGSGRIGAFFAALVLFFFLRRFRMTVIITLSIPLSILIGIVAMYFSGETLNILTLLGLMISVGLLVDNSVVVAENIFRLHKTGLGRREAVIRGAGEISLAIVMATLTTIIVFLPVSLVEGQGQFFLLRLAIPITVSLLASLVVALVFVPLSVYLTLPKRLSDDERPTVANRFHHVLHRAYGATFERMNHGYNRLLAVFLRRRVDLVIAIVLVLFVTQGVAMKGVKLVNVQDEERTSFEIDVVLPQSTTLEEAEEYFGEVEKVLEEMREELDLDGYFIFHVPTYGEVSGWFNNPRTNDLSPRTAIERFLEKMPEKAGSRRYTGLESDDEKESKNIHILSLQGDDAAQLETIADDMEELLLGVEGVIGVKRSGDTPTEELGLVIDRERTQRLGVNPEVVAGVVRNSLGGQSLPKFYREGREIPVRVRFREEDREGLAELYDFQVPTDSGEVVSLSAVTTPKRLDAAKRIWRRNKRTSRTITLELDEEKPEEARRRVMAFVGSLDLPEGVTFGDARRGGGVDEEAQAMLFAMQLSVVFIYLLMGFLFESFILPLSIVLTIPLAMIGVYWTHFLLGYDLDPLGLVGLVILVGVVVNNGIVLIDYVNRLRTEGEGRTQAVLLAADRRFRPIMMTALTTICAMVPLTLAGTTSIGLSYKSFGLTLIGGMATATLLTLLVVPVAYTLFDDLRERAMLLLGRLRVRSEAAPVEGPEPEAVA